MIVHSGLTETYPLVFKKLGIKENKFYSLPVEYQKAILLNNWKLGLNKNNDNEVIKKKILSILKK